MPNVCCFRKVIIATGLFCHLAAIAQPPTLSFQNLTASDGIISISDDANYISSKSGKIIDLRKNAILYEGKGDISFLKDNRHAVVHDLATGKIDLINYLGKRTVRSFVGTPYTDVIVDIQGEKLVYTRSPQASALKDLTNVNSNVLLEKMQEQTGFLVVDLLTGQRPQFFPFDFEGRHKVKAEGGCLAIVYKRRGADKTVLDMIDMNGIQKLKRHTFSTDLDPPDFIVSRNQRYVVLENNNIIVDLTTGNEITTHINLHDLNNVYFINDGQELVAVDFSAGSIYRYSLVHHKKIQEITLPPAILYGNIKISPDGREMAITYYDKPGKVAFNKTALDMTCKVVDTHLMSEIYSTILYNANGFFYSADNKYFISVEYTADGYIIHLRDRNSGKMVKKINKVNHYALHDLKSRMEKRAMEKPAQGILLGHFFFRMKGGMGMSKVFDNNVFSSSFSHDNAVVATLSGNEKDPTGSPILKIDSFYSKKNLITRTMPCLRMQMSPSGKFCTYWQENVEEVQIMNIRKQKSVHRMPIGIWKNVFWSEDDAYLFTIRMGDCQAQKIMADDNESNIFTLVKVNLLNEKIEQCHVLSSVPAVYGQSGPYVWCAYSNHIQIFDQNVQLVHTIQIKDLKKEQYNYTAIFHPRENWLTFLCQQQEDTSKTICAYTFDMHSGEQLRRLTLPATYTDNNFFPVGSLWANVSKNSVGFYDFKNEKHLFHLIMFDENGFIIFTNDNYYYATHSAVDLIRFAKGDASLSFRQFDLIYNRPDKVLALSPNPDPALLESYYKAYLKRLQKMGFREADLSAEADLPVLKVNSDNLPFETDQPQVSLPIEASDPKFLLDRINVWVNDVPVYGRQGISLRGKNLRQWQERLNIPLSAGDNQIQISCLNEKGLESLLEDMSITCNAPARKPDLYVLAIGVSEYVDRNMNLDYAAKDAGDVISLFQAQKEQYGKIYSKTLINRDATAAQVQSLKAWLAQTKTDDRVILFISGHGLLDDQLDYFFATYDVDFAYPKAKGIPYDALEYLLDGIPARQKLILMDACHSGELDKENVSLVKEQVTTSAPVKFRAFNTRVETRQIGLQNSFELMKELFVDLRRSSGATVISSAGGAEYAIEGDAWKNGVFTYSLIGGLRDKAADLNNDGSVMVSELQDYLGQRVSELTQGRQRPTFRAENVGNDWRVW